MKKLLVGLVIDKDNSCGIASVVINVNDVYDPMDDSPDAPQPFYNLRRWVYNAVKNRPGLTAEHIDKYHPDKTFIMSITHIGDVRENMRESSVPTI